MLFELAPEVLEEVAFVADDDLLISEADELIDEFIFELLFWLSARHS